MKRITWCGVAQSPYNDFLLKEVNKFFDLKVYYKIKNEATHPWHLETNGYNFSYIQGNILRVIKRILSSDIVVISGWKFWEHLVIMLIPMKSIKKIYWTDTPNLDKKEWIGVKGYIRRIIVKIVFEVFDEVWSTGKPGCENLAKMGCKKEKIKSFPFFLDLERYIKIDTEKYNKALAFRRRYCNPHTQIVFMCMGQIVTKKKFEDAIKALAFINDRNVILWIAGSGPQEKALKLLASSLNLDNQVKFLGWLQQSEVELAFISSDIFIHPAEFDPFPTVVLDAMTWGKPIIGTYDSGSVRDRVIHGRNGFIYSTGEVEILKKQMQFFMRNKDKIIEFGYESRKTACDYPVDIAIHKLKSLL